MRDYATTAAGFDLQRTAAATLSGTLQALNACVECCDRHALPGRIALFWEGKDGSRASYTFSELKALSGRFANFLQAQGVRPGDCVAGLLPRTPELLVTILGAWRLGAVYQPLFTASARRPSNTAWRPPAARCWSPMRPTATSSTNSPIRLWPSPSADRRGRASVAAISASGPSWSAIRPNSNRFRAAARIRS